MTHAAPAPLIGREFDSFLFASIGDDRHGQPLSVLSALARSDVDPWEEAGALARISRKKAKARLTAMGSTFVFRPRYLAVITAAGSEAALYRPVGFALADFASKALSSVQAGRWSARGAEFGLALFPMLIG